MPLAISFFGRETNSSDLNPCGFWASQNASRETRAHRHLEKHLHFTPATCADSDSTINAQVIQQQMFRSNLEFQRRSRSSAFRLARDSRPAHLAY